MEPTSNEGLFNTRDPRLRGDPYPRRSPKLTSEYPQSLLLGVADRVPLRYPNPDLLDCARLARQDVVRRPRVDIRGLRELRVDLVS